MNTPLPSVRFQVADIAGEPRLIKRERNPAKLVQVGSAVVQIFGRAPGPFTVAWRESAAGRRHRSMRSTFAKAKRLAEIKATEIANGQTAMSQFTEADRASYRRSLEILGPTGLSLELAASVIAEVIKTLGGRISPAQAARDWVAEHPAEVATRKVPELVQEFLAKKRVTGKYKRILDKMLDRFGSQFDGRLLTQVQPSEIEAWLDSLNVGLRTRRNHRSALVSLVKFASGRYVPKGWDVLSQVANPDPPRAAVNIYTPDELRQLLIKAESYKAGRKLVPLIAVTAFAGIRHGEMNEEKKIGHLDWSDFNWDEKTIYIADDVAKTGNDREVDMPDNLIAWLAPYRRPSGKICTVANTSNALCRLRRKAGITGPKKNALRKSFITYRVALTRNIEGVADQAGNSVGVVRKSYKRRQRLLRADAEAWFSLQPPARVLPLFEWAKEKRQALALS